MKDFIKRNHIWGAYILAAAAGIFFVIQAWQYAKTIPPTVWDESMYLYKGYLFAEGRYQPFEDFGPWTNQMPVAFLIPGYIQSFYGPSMEVGRIYAVVIGFLALLGIWAAVRRHSTAWWAAAAVLVVVSNPNYMQVFSQSFSQTLVSMFFAWMLFFGLGDRRQDWELALAAIFCALAGMARINVLPALPLFWLYVYWRYDRRAGRSALVAGLVPLVFFHVIYWPDIMKIWAYWVPPEIFPPMLDYASPWREVFLPEDFSWWPVTEWWGDKTHLAWVGVRSFWQAIRGNFIVLLGLFAGMVLYPWRTNIPRDYRSKQKYKEVFFMLMTFWVLFALHLWAANGKSCQFVCFPGYIMFFFVFALVLVPVSASGWRRDLSTWRQVLIVLFIFALLITLEYNLDRNYLNFRYDLVQNTFDLEIPRIKNWRIEEGTVMFWQLLENKFGINHYPVRRFILQDSDTEVIVRWAKVMLLLGVALPLTYSLANKRRYTKFNFGLFTLAFTFAFAVIFGGGRLFGRVMVMETCQTSVIESYQQVGEELSAYLSDGDQVYYRVKANMLLLELPEVEVFPPQLNFLYTYVEDRQADMETLARFSWWNPVLKEQWLDEADYVLVENRFYDEEWSQRVEDGELEQVFVSSPTASCRGDDAQIVLLEPVGEE